MSGRNIFILLQLLLCLHFLVGCGFAMMKEKQFSESSESDEQIADSGVVSLSRVSPTSVATNDTTPTFRVSNLVDQDVVRVYSDSGCTQLITTQTAAGATLDITLPAFASEGRKNIYVQKTSAQGVVSACSTVSFYYDIDTTIPSFSGSINLQSPYSGLNFSLLPQITATSLAIGSGGPPTRETVYFYSDSSCSDVNQLGYGLADNSGNGSAEITLNSNDIGTNYFYYKFKDAAGNASACSVTPISYDYRKWTSNGAQLGCGEPSTSGVPRGYVVKLANGMTFVGNAFDDNSVAISDCNTDDGGTDRSGNVVIYSGNTHVYLKAPNAGVDDFFGYSLAANGDTLAVGAPCESSDSVTIASDTTGQNNNKSCSGAVYVFKNVGDSVTPNWTLQAFIKASNSDVDDRFGESVDLVGDTLVVGAPYEDSSQSNITNANTSSSDNSVSNSGAIYVYQRLGQTWTQQAYIKASNNREENKFGLSVAISGDTIVVGSPYDDSNLETITNGTTSSTNIDAVNSGAVFVYQRSGTSWAQQAYIKAPNQTSGDLFGYSVDIDGDHIVAGAPEEDNRPTGTNSSPTFSTDDGSSANYNETGSAYVFSRSTNQWSFQTYLKPSMFSASVTVLWTFNLRFGQQVAINNRRIVVSAPGADAPGNGFNFSNTQSDIISYVYQTAPTQHEYGATYLFQQADNQNWYQVGMVAGSATSSQTASMYWVDIDGDRWIYGRKALSSTYYNSEYATPFKWSGLSVAEILSGEPQPRNHLASLNIEVGNVHQYKYKLGLKASTDCSVSAGYSASWISIVTKITDSLAGYNDGEEVRLCLIGQDTTDQIVQYESNATQVDWIVDTSL